MKNRHLWLAGVLVALGYAPAVQAQAIPGVPAGAIPAASSAASAVGPVAAPRTLWSFLGCSWEQKEECRRMLCKLPLGQMLNNAGGPISAISGGLIPSFCPTTPSAEELKDAGAVGAAAQIKADEAAAKERRAAVRYLGTVDCHYWPEAQDALIAALRGDRNECVRYEAALALRNGCCCTKKTMEALIVVLSCGDRDGHPRETSARVHAAARQALDKCLSCYADMNPKPVQENIGNPEKKKDSNPEKKEDGNNTTGRLVPRKIDDAASKDRPVGKVYYARIMEQPMDAIVREGRRVLGATQHLAVVNTSGMSLSRLFDRSSSAPVTQGYIVHGGQPGKAELVAAKPTNLWELLNGRNEPVVVSSYPARSTVVEQAPVRVAAQPGTMPMVQANAMPTSTASATSNIMNPAPQVNMPVQSMPVMTPTMQPPPSMPVNKTVPMMEKQVSPVVAPQKAAPVVLTVPMNDRPLPPMVIPQKTAPVVASTQAAPVVVPQATAPVVAPVTKPAVTVETKTVPAVQPTVAVKAPVATNMLPPATTPVKPATTTVASTVERVSMSTVQDRIKALDSLTAQHKCSPELTAQLIKTAEEDSNDQVRCSAIKAMVRVKMPAERAIPVLSQLGMNLDTTVGKEANNALAQINASFVTQTAATVAVPVATQRTVVNNVQERVKSLDSLNEQHKNNAELFKQLIKTAQEDSNEQVRCSAIRAIVRVKVPAQQAIPVLSQLGMDLDTTVGKEANNALAQINLRLVQE